MSLLGKPLNTESRIQTSSENIQDVQSSNNDNNKLKACVADEVDVSVQVVNYAAKDVESTQKNHYSDIPTSDPPELSNSFNVSSREVNRRREPSMGSKTSSDEQHVVSDENSTAVRTLRRRKTVKFDLDEKLSQPSELEITEFYKDISDDETSGDLFYYTNVDPNNDTEFKNLRHIITGDEEDSSSSSTDNDSLNSEKLIHGTDGYTQYKLYKEIEKKTKIGDFESMRESARLEYQANMAKIDAVVEMARAYYKNPTGKAAEDWKKLKEETGRSLLRRNHVQSHTDTRFHLSTLHEHNPIFTYVLILTQLAATTTICILGKITFAGLEPQLELKTGVKTFLGSETIHKWTPPNIWIGPSERYLISIGTVFAPCMREDIGIKIDLGLMSHSNKDPLGCCEMRTRNTAGTTTEQECEDFTYGIGLWRGGTLCSKRTSGSNSVAHILKPCCTDIKGTCRLVSHEHCIFLGGKLHISGVEHCSQVNCLSSVCGMGGLDNDDDQPWLPSNPQQWWRLPLSLLYHHGIIHVIVVSAAQFVLFRKLEQVLGWLRIILLYLMTGSGGLLAAAIFTPYTPQCGSTATVSGVVGMMLVELLLYWSVVKKPWIELIKISIVMLVLFVSGTLPYVNNFSIILGFVIGVMSAFCFLPFVSFKKKGKKRRVVLVIMAIPMLLMIYFFLFYMFYKVQTLQGCKVCSLINCIPYTDKMCKADLWSG